MNSSDKVPSSEEFARASRIMRERARGLDEVRDAVLRKFQERCPLYAFFILDQRDVDFRAYVFFERDRDVDAAKMIGLDAEMKDYVCSELERVGRGNRHELNIAFHYCPVKKPCSV